MRCPNINSPEWKQLVDQFGLDLAKQVYVLNKQDIPSVKKAKRLLSALYPVPEWALDNTAPGLKLPSRESFYEQNQKVLSSNAINSRLSTKLNSFLSSIGVSISVVDKVTTATSLPALAKAQMVEKTILFTQGALDIKQLGEESAHFYVELMDEKNSQLYKEMYDKVHLYKTYTDVVNLYGDQYREMYGNEAEARLRKEAMAHLITKHIINGEVAESGPKQSFVVRWWDKVFNFIQSIFGREVRKEFNKVKQDPYYLAARQLLESDFTELDLSKEIYGEYYHLSDEAKNIVDRVLSKANQITLDEATHVYSISGRKIKETVTGLVEKLNPFRGSVNEAYKELTQESGTIVHSYIENAIKRATEAISGNQITQPIADNSIYKTIESFISDFVNRDEFKGGRFLTEVRVYDERRDLAGTIDLMIVMPDGTTHLYDWKTTNFKVVNGVVVDERVHPTKERNYNTQLGEYKKILNTRYGVKQFGHVRVLPIQTIFKTKRYGNSTNTFLDKVNLGTDEAYLQPIITEHEKTGIPALDNVLETLINRRKKLEQSMKNLRGSDRLDTKRKFELVNQKIVQVSKAITEVHLNHRIDLFLDFMDDELNRLAAPGTGGLTNYTDEQYLEVESNINFFRELLRKNQTALRPYLTTESQQRIDALNNRLSTAEAVLYDELQNRLRKIETGAGDLTQADKQVGFLSRIFRYASQATNKKVYALTDLVFKQKDIANKEYKEVNNKIAKAVDKLQKWGTANGLGGIKVYSKIVDNGRLVSKYSKSFRDRMKQAFDRQSAEDIAFLTDNTVFDTDKYERLLEETTAMYEASFPKEQADRLIEQFKQTYDVRINPDAFTKRNYFLSWKDNPEHHSTEYKYIYQKGNEPLKEFYELFINLTQEWRDVMGLDKDAKFVWNVKAGTLERFNNLGLSAFSDMPSVLTQLNSLEEAQTEANLDENGEEIHRIPKYFIRPFLKTVKNADGTVSQVEDPTQKSQDLGKVLSLAGAMAINHKYVSQIEDTAKILQVALRPENNQEIVTDFRGRPVQDLLRGGVMTSVGKADTLEQFNDYMNYYIYGVRNKGKNSLGVKVLNNVSKYYVATTLGLSPMSITANVVGGVMNASMLAKGEKHFNYKDFTNAFYHLLPSRNKKAYAIMGYFDLMGDTKVFEQANNLSVDKLSKSLSYDKLFIGHELGDKWIRNGVLLAMMKGYTIKDGAIVKKTGNEKSLYDLTDVTNDTFNIPGMSEGEYYKFRRKVHVITERILGNSTRDNIRAANLTVWGRVLLMFRGWIPRTVDERFGELRKDYDLGEYEYGRYRAFYKGIVDKTLGETATNLKNSFLEIGILGFKPWNSDKASAGIDAKLQELYYQKLQEDPTLDISLAEFKQLYHSNMKSAMLELQLIGTFLTLLLALKYGGDDEKSKSHKVAIAVADRALSELAFFIGLGFNDIVKNGIPLMGLVTKITGILKSIFTDIFGNESQPSQYRNSLDRARDFIPVLNAIHRLETMAEKGQ